MEGVLVRVGIGKWDLEKGVVEVVCCDMKEKVSIFVDGVVEYVVKLLDEI